jgi:protein-S-isoprenylcysteine O-methyltransferase Ste14
MVQPWWKNARGEWYAVAQILIFALILFGPAGPDWHPDLPAPVHIILLAGGLALGMLGFGLVAAGYMVLGSNLSILPHPKNGATLVQTGVYGMVRHPMYSGVIVAAVGWALLNSSLMTSVYAAVLFVFFDAKSRREERWLTRQFPEYAAYCTRVHKLIPWIY